MVSRGTRDGNMPSPDAVGGAAPVAWFREGGAGYDQPRDQGVFTGASTRRAAALAAPEFLRVGFRFA
jgi:hypothetical protein